MTTPATAPDQPDIEVGTANGYPIFMLSDNYRPATGDQMSEDIVAAFREHASWIIHPGYDPGYD